MKNGIEIHSNSDHCVGLSHDSNHCEVCIRRIIDDQKIKTSNTDAVEISNIFPEDIITFNDKSYELSLQSTNLSENDQDNKIAKRRNFKRELQYIDPSNIISTKRTRIEIKYYI